MGGGRDRLTSEVDVVGRIEFEVCCRADGNVALRVEVDVVRVNGHGISIGLEGRLCEDSDEIGIESDIISSRKGDVSAAGHDDVLVGIDIDILGGLEGQATLGVDVELVRREVNVAGSKETNGVLKEILK